MRPPPIVLLDDSDDDAPAFAALVGRIGLANSVLALATLPKLKSFLLACDGALLPIAICADGVARSGDIRALAGWQAQQSSGISDIPTLTVIKPFDLQPVMAAFKALALPEKARIDLTTLMVRIELWPRGTRLDD